MTTRVTIYHVRRRLRRSRSTNRYLDHSDRGRGTFCGAPCTEHDSAWADRERVAPRVSLGVMTEPCAACLAAIARTEAES